MSKPDPKKVAPSPSWTLDKGVSFSLLSRFINCRERFRLYAVEGMREEKSSKGAMDWGTYVHELIEIQAKYQHLSSSGVIRRAKRTIGGLPKAQADLIFHKYMEHYEDHQYDYFAQEQEFRVKYTMCTGHQMNLVGKTDEIIDCGNGELWIQENKTKEKINEYKIESGLIDDLQTMMYAVCVQLLFKKPVTGVVYNVIRNPTSKPKLLPATKTRKKRRETQKEYLARLEKEIDDNPKHYFKRWEIPFPSGHIESWCIRSFDPILLQL
jgi:hypothetical protein